MSESEFFKTQKEAAAYAGVSVRTIRRWKNKLGMPMTQEGYYIKQELDRYKRQEVQSRTTNAEEIKQICREIDVAGRDIGVAVGTLNNIKARLWAASGLSPARHGGTIGPAPRR